MIVCGGYHANGTCPNCGYCPCCGRSNWHHFGWRQQPVWPAPQPIWVQPQVHITYTTTPAPGSAHAAVQALAG